MNGNSEQRNMMKGVQTLGFALVEATLFLDSHPNNQKALEFFRKNLQAYNALKEQYTKTYGPITLSDAAGDSWTWVETPWPWQN